ncbi:MAG: TonB-dependent receptor [Saprospiraceae bacterium]
MRIFLSIIFSFSALCAIAQVQVTFLDELGEAMYGVNANNTDYTFTATSDFEGRIQIPELKLTDVISFKVIGYESITKTVVELVKAQAGAKLGTGVLLSLKPEAKLLEEAVVVGRRNDVATDIPWTVAMVTSKDIEAVNPQTSAHALESSGEVFVQRSQMGGGSPIIRGFEANRVLLVVDGVRLNNAIYRSGHLQNAISVDPSMLDRVEVLFGAGSLLYGSDALGGVVHFRTKEPKLHIEGTDRTGGNFFTRFSSANLEKTAHVDYNIASKKWASQTSLTISSFADQRAGTNYNHEFITYGQTPFYVPDGTSGEVRANSDPFLQRGTGYDQIDVMQKIKWQIGKERYLLFNAQYSNSSDVPRYDQLSQVSGDRPSDLKFAEWYYGPQQRVFGSVRLVSSKKSFLHDRSQWIAAYQKLDEDRYDRRLDAMWRNFSFINVGVSSLTFDADKYFGENQAHRLSYGFEGQHNTVGSIAGRTHLFDETVLLDQISRYPSGGSTMSSGGVYTTYRYGQPGAKFNAQAGLRYSAVHLAAVFGNEIMTEPVDWPQELRDGVSSVNSALTYASGVTFSPTKSTKIQALASTAFRAANIDDFGKMRVKNGFVSVPNIDLEPERALNAELTLTQNFGRLKSEGFAARLGATAFYSKIQNIVVRTNGALPNGDTTFVSGGDEYRVQVNTNADEGEIRGVGLKADFTYGKNFSLAARGTLTKGISFAADGTETPLSHIPPMYGQGVMRYVLGKYTLRGTYRFNGLKAWEDYAPAGSSDNEDLAIEGVGTPAWSTVDVHIEMDLNKKLRLQGGIENIGDLHYRPFSSGVSAPGRNFIVSLRGSF